MLSVKEDFLKAASLKADVIMIKKPLKEIIPVEFKKYFWDVDFNALSLVKHKGFILERLLNYGSFSTFSWIFQIYTNDEVRQLLKKKGKRSLSRSSFYFWEKISEEKSLWKKSLN
jgi:hypothetical protein